MLIFKKLANIGECDDTRSSKRGRFYSLPLFERWGV
jgi:hypothetical protein